MIVLIVKDSATQVPREVKDLQEAQAFADQGHHVLVQNEDGSRTPLAEALAAAPADAAPAAQVTAKTDTAAAPPARKSIVSKVKAAVSRKKK